MSRLARIEHQREPGLYWSRQFADLQGTGNEDPTADLLPVAFWTRRPLPTNERCRNRRATADGGYFAARLEGGVDAATLTQVVMLLTVGTAQLDWVRLLMSNKNANNLADDLLRVLVQPAYLREKLHVILMKVVGGVPRTESGVCFFAKPKPFR